MYGSSLEKAWPSVIALRLEDCLLLFLGMGWLEGQHVRKRWMEGGGVGKKKKGLILDHRVHELQ